MVIKPRFKFIPRSGSGGGYEDKVNAALNSGSLPDVLTLDGPNTAAYAHSKIIQPIDRDCKIVCVRMNDSLN